MARIFSIQFKHNDFLNNALIMVHETAFFTEYKITNISDEIRRLLPGDKVISTSPNELFFPNIPVTAYNKLAKEIIEAITEHLHAFQS